MRDPDEEQAWTGPRSAGKAGTSTKSPGMAARPWSGSPQGGESAREQRRRLRRRRSGEAAYLSQVWGSQSLGVGNVGHRGVRGDEGRGEEESSALRAAPCLFALSGALGAKDSWQRRTEHHASCAAWRAAHRPPALLHQRQAHSRRLAGGAGRDLGAARSGPCPQAPSPVLLAVSGLVARLA